MSVRRVELKIFDDDEHVTDPAYILKIPLPSLNELILLHPYSPPSMMYSQQAVT